MLQGRLDLAAFFSVAIFVGWSTAIAQVTKDTAADRDLNALGELLGRDLAGDDLKTLQFFANDKREPIKLILTAIQYRHDTEQHRNQFFSRFAVHDYKARKRGVYNMVEPTDVTTTVRRIEEKHSKSKPSVVMLLAFSHYRDKNIWFTLNGQRVSAARFLRAAFFAGAFLGSSLDATEVANMIDAKTREIDLKEGDAAK